MLGEPVDRLEAGVSAPERAARVVLQRALADPLVDASGAKSGLALDAFFRVEDDLEADLAHEELVQLAVSLSFRAYRVTRAQVDVALQLAGVRRLLDQDQIAARKAWPVALAVFVHALANILKDALVLVSADLFHAQVIDFLFFLSFLLLDDFLVGLFAAVLWR